MNIVKEFKKALKVKAKNYHILDREKHFKNKYQILI